jgi:hypothetical protein
MKNWPKDFRLKYHKKGNEMKDYFYLSLENRQDAVNQLKLIASTMEVDSFSIEQFDPYCQPNRWNEIE